MKFGIDELEVIKEIKALENEKIVSDNAKWNEPEQPTTKRRGLFGKTASKKEKDFPPSSTSSETIWREINLFWPEAICITGAVIAGVILMFVIRYMSLTSLELIRDMLSEQAYLEVAGLLQNINTMFIGVGAIPILVLIGFFAYRMFVFTPRKNKYMVARIKREGAIRFSVDAIKDMEMPFARGMLDDKMKITNPRKHWIENTGKPIIVLFEGDDSNADLNVMAGNVSSKARDINTINENAIALGRRIERYIQEKKEGWMTPMNILLILILGAVGLVLFLVLKNPETTAQLMGAI